MNCDETFNAGICYVTDAYKRVCRFNEELHADLEKCQSENAKLRELVRLMVRRHTPISPCKNIPCGECPVKDECDQEDALMRELGVEVDDD